MKRFLLFLTCMLMLVVAKAFPVSVGDQVKLITSTSDLNTSDTYIYCSGTSAMGGFSGTNKFLSRVTGVINKEISNENELTSIAQEGAVAFKLVEGTVTGTYAMNIGTDDSPAYIKCTTASNNNLTSVDKVDQNCNVEITFDSSNKRALIKYTAISTNSAIWCLQFNSDRFSNYKNTQVSGKIYKVVKVEEDPDAKPGTETFDLTDFHGGKSGDNVTYLSQTPVTINLDKSKGTTAPRYWTQNSGDPANEIRVYANNIISVSVPSPYYLISVSIKSKSGGTFKGSCSAGLFSNNTTSITTGSQSVVWNSTNQESSVDFTPSATIYLTEITVEYGIKSTTEDPVKKDVTLSFDAQKVSGNKVLGGLSQPELTVTPEAAKKYVVYSSSDPTVASVNESTGVVSMLKAGTTTIYAKIKDNDEYNYAEASYELTVYDGNSGETPTDLSTTITNASFNYDSSGYDVKTFEDKPFGVTYTSVLSVATVGSDKYIQFNTNNSNGGKGSAIAVTTISDDYYIESIDVDVKSASPNMVVYSYSKAFPAPKLSTAYTVPNEAVKKNDGFKESKNIQINDNAFLLLPSSTGVIQLNSITVNYKKKIALGELTATYGDGNEVEEYDEVEVDLGETFTFTAENAESISLTITVDDNDETISLPIDQGKATWTVDKVYELAMVEATATLGTATKELGFFLTVNAPIPATPVVKIGEEELLNGGSKVVKANTEVSITCNDAKSIIVKRGEEQVAELTTAPFNYTITESGNYTFTGKYGDNQSETSFAYTFTIGEVDPNAPAVGSNFKQVLNANKDKELEKDAYYLIGRHYNDLQVAMSKNFNNGNFIKSDNVSYEAVNERYRDEANQKYLERSFDVLTMTGDDVLIFKLDQNDEGQWGLKTVNYGDGLDASQKYLTNSTEEGASVTALALSDDFAAVNIEYPEKSNNVRIIFPGTTGRILTYNTNSGTFNNQQTTSANVQLYKYSTAKVFHHPYKDTQILLKAGESHTIELEGDDHPEVNYSVKQNTKCVTIEEGSNVIKTDEIREADEATIVARWDESEDWFPNIIEFTVVFRYPAELGFRYAEVRGKKDVGVAAQAAYYTGDGTLTYYIEKEVDGEWVDASDEIAINSETGMIRPDDLVNPIIDEPYRVRVHVTDDKASYIEKDAYYTLKIEAPEGGNGEAVSGEAMFNFVEDNYGMFNEFNATNTGNSQDLFYYYENNINENEKYADHVPVMSISLNGVTLDFTGRHRYFDNAVRLYTEGTITFSVPNGSWITKIEFGDDSSGMNKLNLGEGCKGTYKPGKNGNGGIWNCPEGEKVSTVTFTQPNEKYAKINTINVIVESQKFEGKQPVNLAFDVTASDVDRHISFFEDQVIPLPPLTYNTIGGTIDFSEAVENGDLVLSFDPIKPASEDTPAEEVKGRYYANNFNDIKVELDEPGVYTFRAEYKGEDFLQGMAILRLNVFPRLTVTTENEDLLSDHELGEDPEITLIHYNEGSNDNSTTVKIPSLDELLKGEDGYRYSTIEVTEVEVKHGGKTEIYTKEVGEGIPATYDFSTDGYVKYTIVYGGEDDFKVESIVNVIFMPHFVDNTKIAGELEITPVVNTTVLYRTYSTPGSNNDKEEVKARRLVDNEGLEWAELTESTKFTYQEALNNEKVKEGDVYVVVAKPTKDISEYVASEKNGLLEGDITEYYLTASGNTTTGIEDVELSEDADVEYFNLQGVKIKNPEKGGIYIKVTGKKAEKVIL